MEIMAHKIGMSKACPVPNVIKLFYGRNFEIFIVN
jgi:hypothetical protein